MKLDFSQPDKNYPTSHKKYDEIVQGNYTKSVFQRDIGDVNKFINRFRLAKEFVNIQFDTYQPETAEGYNALFKVFLSYSAFEQFLKIIGKDNGSIISTLRQYSLVLDINYILNQDSEKKLYNFLLKHLDQPNHRNNLSKVYNRESDNILHIAKSIRHIFVHGLLTPSANRNEAKITANICNRIFDFLIEVMDKEFSKTVDTFLSER